MRLGIRIHVCALLVLCGLPCCASATSSVAPFPDGKNIVWSHAPYEVGACTACHESNNPRDPGSLTKPVNDLCFSCHEQLKVAMEERPVVHAAALVSCTSCHNPHNATQRKLLIESVPDLCFSCHDAIKQLVTDSKVGHDTVTKGAACLHCHHPHSANVEHLLFRLPGDLCVTCHGTDGIVTSEGDRLTNFKTLLAENPVQHGPVAANDCTACHAPHGSENFRLLVEAYPAKFYAPYEPRNYALCYRCHNDQTMTSPHTTTLTKFRNGDLNLHYLHVNKEKQGRTCRACHEVHASKKPHQIRDGVPYGPSGWILPVKYTQTASGGACEKTCHPAKSYDYKKSKK